MVWTVARFQIERILRDVSEKGSDMKDELESLERFFALTDEPVYAKPLPLRDNERFDRQHASQFEPREPTAALKKLPASVPDFPVSVIDSPTPSITPSLRSHGRAETTVDVDPRVLRVLRPQPRSLVRRIAERLVLGVAALTLSGVWVWMAGQTPSRMNTLPLRATNASPEAVALPGPDAAIINPESQLLMPVWFSPQTLYSSMPAWFSPQIFYSPTMAPSATAPPPTEVPVPPGR